MAKFKLTFKGILIIFGLIISLSAIGQKDGLIKGITDNEPNCGPGSPNPNNVIDVNSINCFHAYHTCTIDLTIEFNYSIAAAKIFLTAEKDGFDVLIHSQGKQVPYHNTINSYDEFYIIAPDDFEAITLYENELGTMGRILCNISINEIDIGDIKADYQYDNSGNMTKHTLIILGSDVNKLSNLDDHEYPENHIDKGITDEDILPYTDEIDDNKISIYPNPTKGELKVDIEMGDLEYANNIFISVHDASGRKILSKNAINAGTTLNLSNQSPGLYILTVTIDNNSKQWKIIKE